MTPRPRKIVYVTAGLGGGGAEAMLTRLVTARPSIADEITVVSLLAAEAHIANQRVERLRAGGVNVAFTSGDYYYLVGAFVPAVSASSEATIIAAAKRLYRRVHG